MWLFDNIFLDEDAIKSTTAVAENPEPTPEVEAPPTTFENTNPEVATATEPLAAPQWELVTNPAPTPTPEAMPSGMSFDIGGDLDFGGVSPTPSSTTVESSQAAPQEAVSFTVNGVTYNTNSTPTETIPAVTSTPEPTSTDTVGSIAMIQWSTAASGINIIETTTSEAPETQETTPVMELTLETAPETPDSNSLMSILGDVTADTPVEPTTTIEVPESTPEVTPDFSFSTSETTLATEVISSIPETIAEPVIETIAPEAIISEPVISTPTEPVNQIEPTKAPIKIPEPSQASSDLGGILDGFINELNEREMEISRIIMKRHELAKRRTDVEEEYKTRILALNMEDEFLKSKANRERSEQDKLQSVIKNFQKQIAANE